MGWMGATKVWAVTKAAHVEHVLNGPPIRVPPAGSLEASLALKAGVYHIKMFMGSKSVGVLEGHEWQMIRKQMSHYVQKSSHLKGQFACVHSLANEMVDFFVSPTRSHIQEVSGPLFSMAYDVLANAVFGEHSGFLRKLNKTGKSDPVVHALCCTMLEFARRMGSFNPLDWMYIFDCFRPSQKHFVQSYRIVWNYVAEIVNRRRNDKTESFLSHLVQGASERMIFDNVQTCMWAGHESTAAALSFALHELSSRPELQQRLEAEVQSAVGEAGELKYEHIGKLPLVSAVIEEVLRLHPPAIWTNRGLQDNIVLDDVVLPRGSIVFVPIEAVHHSPLNWDEPLEFRPERFLDSRPVPGSHIPFGLLTSRRVCPGYSLAPFELKVVIATFALRGLRVSKPAGTPEPDIRANGAFQLCLENFLHLWSEKEVHLLNTQ